MEIEKGSSIMKKLLPLALLGAAIGAAGYFVDKKNKEHVEETLDALDEISQSAEEAVEDLSKEVKEDMKA